MLYSFCAADSLFAFGHMRGLHFAKLFVLEEPTDPGGRPIPASLVLMTEVDAPLRSHLAELIDVGGDGIDEAFGFCAGYPGPAAQRRDADRTYHGTLHGAQTLETTW